MSYVDWKIHGDDTVAAYLDEIEFKGMLEQRIAIPPDCAAIVIRDGKVASAMHGAHLSFGGIWQKIKEAFGGKHAVRILVADLKPFPVTFDYDARTRDDVEVVAEVAFELAVNPEKPANVMGMILQGTALTRCDVLRRIEPHLKERILTRAFATHASSELRANRGLQDQIQADIMQEVDRVAGDLGLLVRAVSVNFGRNAEEAQAIEIRSRQRAERLVELEYQQSRRELEREQSTTVFEVESEHALAKLKNANETEIKQMLLSRELNLSDARSTAQRVEEMKALKHQLEVAQAKRLAEFDSRIASEKNELERRKIELERKRVDMAYGGELKRHTLELEKLEKLQELELKKRSSMQDLEVAGEGHELNLRKLRDLQSLQLDAEKSRHALAKDNFQTQHSADMERKLQESQAELDRLKLQASMSPDHLLAIQAGASPEVARVFAEKARMVGADREALLREMIEMSKQAKADSDTNTRAMFERAVDRMSEMGGARPAEKRAEDAANETSECPKCHFRVPVAHRFCKNCGHQMRT